MNAEAAYPLPAKPNPQQLLFTYNTNVRRWPGALRAMLAILIPGAFAVASGNDKAILLCAAGAFAVIYGEGHPFRTRLRVMVSAATLITLASTGGILVGKLVFAPGHGHWWLLLAGFYTAAIGVIGATLQNGLRLPVPGCFFIVMVGGGSTMLARTDTAVWEVLGWTLFSAVVACIIGMFPALLDKRGPERSAVEAVEKAAESFCTADDDILSKHHQAQTATSNAWQALADAGHIRGGRVVSTDPEGLVQRAQDAQQRIVQHNLELNLGAKSEMLNDDGIAFDPRRTAIPHTRPTGRYRLYRSAVRNSHAVVTGEKVAIASIITVIISVSLGFDRPDWGAVSALLVLQWGPDHIPGTVKGIQRMIGSILGVGLFTLIHFFGVQGWSLLIVLAICQFCAEIFIARNYALCLVFSTPLALLMGNSAGRALGDIVTARFAEIFISVAVAMLVLWFFKPRAVVNNHYRLQERVIESMSTLLGALHIRTPEEALAARRDLQYELLSERRAMVSLAIDNQKEVSQFWDRHIALQQTGYFLLDFCSAHPDRAATRSELNVLVTKIREA